MLGMLTTLFIILSIGVSAICLGIWHESKKEVKGRGRGWKYLMFSAIGILSFLAGFYLGDEMQLGLFNFQSQWRAFNNISICLDNLYSFIFPRILYFERAFARFRIKGIWHLLPLFLLNLLRYHGLWRPRALLCEIYKCREIWGAERICHCSRGGIREVSIP